MTKKIIAFSILLILSSCAEVSQQEKEIKKVLGERLKLSMFDTIQYGPNLDKPEPNRKTCNFTEWNY